MNDSLVNVIRHRWFRYVFILLIVLSATPVPAHAYQVGDPVPVKSFSSTKGQLTPLLPTTTRIPDYPNMATHTPIPTSVTQHVYTWSSTQSVTKIRASTDICQSAAIPAYFYASDPYWTQILNSVQAGNIAIYNPADGPGASKNQEYQNVINTAKAKGIIMMGYVYTGYGTRSQAVVKNEIDTYFTMYGTTSIFLDEASAAVSDIPYYQGLYAYIKNRGGKIMINPGTVPDEGYMAVSDYAMIYENTYSVYLTATFPSWITKYPASRFVHLVYATPGSALSNALELSKNRHAGMIYITDDNLPNPWDTLPPYWQNEMMQICPSTGIKGDANKDGKVDGLDYVIWLNNYGKTGVNGPSVGDFNSDAKVDGMDYIIWLNSYGT